MFVFEYYSSVALHNGTYFVYAPWRIFNFTCHWPFPIATDTLFLEIDLYSTTNGSLFIFPALNRRTKWRYLDENKRDTITILIPHYCCYTTQTMKEVAKPPELMNLKIFLPHILLRLPTQNSIVIFVLVCLSPLVHIKVQLSRKML